MAVLGDGAGGGGDVRLGVVSAVLMMGQNGGDGHGSELVAEEVVGRRGGDDDGGHGLQEGLVDDDDGALSRCFFIDFVTSIDCKCTSEMFL